MGFFCLPYLIVSIWLRYKKQTKNLKKLIHIAVQSKHLFVSPHSSKQWDISSHVFFFLKEQNGKFEESVCSAGGLEIPIFLTFKSTCSVTQQKMKTIGSTAPVRCVPVASPVYNFAGTASLVSNYGFRTNEWKSSLPGHKEPLSTVLFGETGCPHLNRVCSVWP